MYMLIGPVCRTQDWILHYLSPFIHATGLLLSGNVLSQMAFGEVVSSVHFSFMNMCRTGKKRGEAAAFFFKDVFQGKKITLVNFISFEYFSFILKSAPKMWPFTIYRSPRYYAHFTDDFAELLSVISMECNFFIMIADSDIYVWNESTHLRSHFGSGYF